MKLFRKKQIEVETYLIPTIRSFYIRKDGALYIQTKDTKVLTEPALYGIILVATTECSITGTYQGATKSGIVLNNWRITKNEMLQQ